MKWLKVALVTVLMLLVVAPCFASVTGEIIGKQIDENGNIIIQTQYKVDGVEVQSRYPQDAQGRYYWVTRYTFQNFDGMDAKGIEARIQQDVDAFAQSLITKKYIADANAKLDLSGLVGKTFTSNTADIQVSPTKALTVDTKGMAQEKVLVPAEAPESLDDKIEALQESIDAMQTTQATALKEVISK